MLIANFPDFGRKKKSRCAFTKHVCGPHRPHVQRYSKICSNRFAGKFFTENFAESKIPFIFAPTNGGLAQLARALAWHARGHEFESRILHQEGAKKFPIPVNHGFTGIFFGRNAEKGIEKQELKTLLNKEIPIPRLAQVRDIFCFCCLTGPAFTDLQQLKPEHLVADIHGKIWIRKARQKAKNMCNTRCSMRRKRLSTMTGNTPTARRTACCFPYAATRR